MVIQSVIFFAALLLPDFYIWKSFIAADSEWWATPLWFLPSAAAILSFIAFNKGWAHNTFMRLFLAIVILSVIPKILFSVLNIIFGWQAGLAVASVFIAAMAYGFFFGWRRIVVRTATCSSPLLPQEFDGYRILQLSDIHIGTFLRNPKFIKKLADTVNAQKADVIVFTGDLVNVSATEVLPFLHDLGRMKAHDGIFSIMGNHDYCEYGHLDHEHTHGHHLSKAEREHALKEQIGRNQNVLQYLEGKIGWRLLNDEHVVISRGKSHIAIIGVENISRPPFPEYGNLEKAMEGLPDGMFKILLSHDPSHWRRGVLHKTDIALTLSGHTHAGQVKIGRFSPAKWAYNEWGGKYTEGGSMLYVSLGIGGTMPFRFGAWPEIDVITLSRQT